MPRLRSYHLHLPLYHVDHNKNLMLVYALRVMRNLVSKLVLFFVPIFIFQQGAESANWQFLPGGDLQRGMLLVAGYFLIYRLVSLLTSIPIGRALVKWGYQPAFVVSHLIYGLLMVMLQFATNYPWLILLVAVVNGLSAVFWISYFSLLSRHTLKKNIGQDLGLLQFLLKLVEMISPGLGGWIALKFGFQTLFLSGLLGVIIGLILSIMLTNFHEHDTISWAEFKTWLSEKRFKRLALSCAGRYFNDAGLVLWPLYVLFLVGSIDRVGFLYTLSLFLAMISSLLIGSYLDHHRDRKPYWISGTILAGLWLLRTQIGSFWQIAVVDTVDKLASHFHWLFYDSIFIKRGKGKEAVSYYVYREMIYSAVAVAFWMLVGLVFSITDIGWQTLFVLAAIGVMLSWLVTDKKSKE